MTYIKAEAEYLLARLGIEGVDVAARFGNVGAGTLDFHSSYHSTTFGGRYCGWSVRPLQGFTK